MPTDRIYMSRRVVGTVPTDTAKSHCDCPVIPPVMHYEECALHDPDLCSVCEVEAARDEAELACIRAVCPGFCGWVEPEMPHRSPDGKNWWHGSYPNSHRCGGSAIYELRRTREKRGAD